MERLFRESFPRRLAHALVMTVDSVALTAAPLLRLVGIFRTERAACSLLNEMVSSTHLDAVTPLPNVRFYTPKDMLKVRTFRRSSISEMLSHPVSQRATRKSANYTHVTYKTLVCFSPEC